MPALFAYLLTISIFIGGGYAGLHFLAGDFDAPALPKAEKSDGVKSDARMQSGKSRSPSAQAVATPSKPQEAAATKVTADGSASETPSPPSVTPAIAQQAPVESKPQAPPDIAVNTPKPDAAISTAAAAQASFDKDPPKKTVATTDDVATALGEKSGPGLLPETVAPDPLEARAAIPRAQRKEARAERPRTARTVQKKSRSASSRATRKPNDRRTEPVLMVLRTIELPNGRRVRQLLTQDQARMDDD
jgi:hypothetical protein